ncbi:MAG: DCC1-like thiol-disulfide oxidoreductase family protein [Aestuariivirga sp.]
MIATIGESKGDVWFVYDGDCPICNFAANALQIRSAIGNLNLVNARLEPFHSVMQEVRAKRLNLNDGMVIKFQDTCYHGADALHVMAMLGTRHGWFNRMNVYLFRSKMLSSLFYPAMRAARNFAIRLKGVPPILNLENDA